MIKRTISDLAFFGGKKAFDKPLHVGRPNIGDRDYFLQRLNKIFDDCWLTNYGPVVDEFQRKVAAELGVKHCIATCNGTVALELASRALNMQGEVIVPSFTFVATAHALQWQEITPVFCDIDPLTHNLDPDQIRKMITPRTTGIIPVNVWGRPCDIDLIETIAKEHNLKLLFDSSHAFRCSYKGKMIGGFGDAEVFSFHATKFVNTFEGGMVATNDDALAKKIYLMKNFGFAGKDKVIYLGINGKMSEVSAAMGLASLRNMDELIEKNRNNYLRYKKNLEAVSGLSLMDYDDKEKCNFQYIIVEVDQKQTGVSRDRIVEIFEAENILARRYFYPAIHRMEPYRSYYPHAGLLLPETESLVQRVLSLPTGDSINEEIIDQICALMVFVIEHSEELERDKAS